VRVVASPNLFMGQAPLGQLPFARSTRAVGSLLNARTGIPVRTSATAQERGTLRSMLMQVNSARQSEDHPASAPATMMEQLNAGREGEAQTTSEAPPTAEASASAPAESSSDVTMNTGEEEKNQG